MVCKNAALFFFSLTVVKVLCKLFQVGLCTLALGSNADGDILEAVGVWQALVQMSTSVIIKASNQQSNTIGATTVVLGIRLSL